MLSKPYVLLVDADANHGGELRDTFETEGYSAELCGSVANALACLRRRPPALIIADDRLDDGSGVDILASDDFKAGTPLFIMSHDGSVSDVVDAVRAGASDVLEKPVFPGHVLSLAGKALETTVATSKRDPAPVDELARPPIIGDSKALRDIMDSLKLLTKAPRATVLIQGESGTGKELIARAIHFDSPRGGHPFLAVNCATLTESLLEAELFGYEKGSFTGALDSGKKGLFEAADGGTLFLDEVGELAPGLQAKLLRVLQEGSFKRIGGLTDIKVDVRIIAATNRDLRVEVKDGRFRADLFYRLNVVPVEVPPLRDRRADIPLLCDHFLGKFAADFGKTITGLSARARDKMLAYHWPGNIRELRNVCEYAAIVSDGEVIDSRHLTIPEVEEEGDAREALPLKDRTLRGMESELIRMVLSETRFNITRAANVLGINRSTLYNKMRDYGLRRDDRPKIRQSV